ncbi:MAG: galactokinase [Opitutales bacterium]|jgi:galactokinase|nr:galactokinase [Opitutales bacterium]MDP4644943.1 galactokinase [Opitutales bacterium]MDP4776762.1 galactokinase [Opitutales bacterium]MDP4882891.1 galactokinase [Opitutales bacterium]MDP5080400.1 galactokinase [Opitutales bacterium]
MSEKTKQFFKSQFNAEPTYAAFAPGRIEFIGNHTDYNGGLVMGVAVTEGITVCVALRDDQNIGLVSDGAAAMEIALDDLKPIKGPASWTNYPVGVTHVMRGLGMKMPVGYNIAVTSTLPAGAGMSSSAAFELATAKALAALYGFETDTVGFARIGRKAENEFVGMPCGILDQGVSAFGEADSIVLIDCATEVFRTKLMPKDTHFWILNSNKKHALVDSAYADRFQECKDALAILQKRFPEAATLSQLDEAQVRACEAELGDVLFRRALHVVTENARVGAVESALAVGDLAAVGAAISASHESSRVNFENSIPELDTLVDLLKKQPYVYGARLTGGGFGGAVMAFTGAEFGAEHAAVVAAAYQAEHGLEATVIHTQAGQGAQLL